MKKLSDDLYGFTDNMHERALALETRIKELEETLRDALGSFKGTQCVAHYPKLHWSRRACELLGEPTIQPGYIAFTRS